MRDLTFYSVHMPPLPGPHLDVDIGTLCYSRRSWFDTDWPSLLLSPQKLNGQDRLTEVDHSVDGGIFQALRGFVLSMYYSIDTTHGNACDRRRIPQLFCGRWLCSGVVTPPWSRP